MQTHNGSHRWSLVRALERGMYKRKRRRTSTRGLLTPALESLEIRSLLTHVPFTPHAVAVDPNGANDVFATDIDGDGDIDLLTADRGSTISLYENDGNQGFAVYTVSTNAANARAVHAADVDSDGDIDVLSASFSDDKIAWYENIGNQNFTEHVISTTADFAQDVIAVDFDSDGDVDVLSASLLDNKVAWYENDGSQSFTERVISSTDGGPRSIFVTDLDRDGDLDVLAAYDASGAVLWFENDGSQAFTERNVSVNTAGGQSVFSIDMDGDGDLDVLVAANYDDKISWFENDGIQSFTEHTITVGADGARSVFATDVDRDGDIDVLSASDLIDTIAWYQNDGQQSFSTHSISNSIESAFAVIAADIDRDGDTDVVGVGQVDDRLTWFENTATLHSSAAAFAPHTVSNAVLFAVSVTPSDVDGDGDLDLVSAARDADTVFWHENTTGTGDVFVDHTVTTTADVVHSVTTADIDGDGDTDLVSASIDDDTIAWYENTAGDGSTFSAHVVSTAPDGPISVFAADIDGDGDIDLVSASINDATVAWYENAVGDGSVFVARTVAGNALFARSVFAADIDGDGDVDIAAAADDGDRISWYENSGDGSAFSEHTVSTDVDRPNTVVIADIDADGDADLVSANLNNNEITWFENTAGNGSTFSKHVVTNNAHRIYSVWAADIDADGDLDLASASFDDDKVAWYENLNGDGSSFAEHTIATNADGAFSVAVGDVDGDGDADVISASRDDSRVSWYENRGGQFALATLDTAPITIANSAADDLLAITARHRGRSGDADVELTAFELVVEESAGDPLTTIEANSIIDRFSVYLDGDDNGTFDLGIDTVVGNVDQLTLDNGRFFIEFTDNDPNVLVAHGAPRRYFVVAQLQPDASSQAVNSFRVTHVTESSSTAEDANTGVPLQLEFAANVASGVVSTLPEVQFSQAAYQISEDGAPVGATIQLHRTGATGLPSSVSVSFSDVTATGGIDYDDSPTLVVFAGGETSKTLQVPIQQDGSVEGPEQLTLIATANQNIVVADQGTAILEILDDDVVVPPGPTQFTGPLSVISDTTPTVAWADHPGSDQYDFRAYSLVTGQEVANQQISGDTTFTFTQELPSFATYQATVRAIHAGVLGEWASTIFVIDGLPPGPVPEFTGPQDNINDTTTTLTWREFPGADSYRIWLYDFFAGVEVLTQDAITTTKLESPRIEPFKLYQAFLQVNLNGGGVSPLSTPLFFNVGTHTPPLAAPDVFLPVSPASTQPTIVWTELAGAEDYEVFIYDINTGQQVLVQNTGGNTYLNVPSPLQSGNEYSIYVRGITDFNEGGHFGRRDIEIAQTEGHSLPATEENDLRVSDTAIERRVPTSAVFALVSSRFVAAPPVAETGVSRLTNVSADTPCPTALLDAVHMEWASTDWWTTDVTTCTPIDPMLAAVATMATFGQSKSSRKTRHPCARFSFQRTVSRSRD